jgi:hypothetical protein
VDPYQNHQKFSGLEVVEKEFWGAHIVHTLGLGLGRTGVGSGLIPYVSRSSQ